MEPALSSYNINTIFTITSQQLAQIPKRSFPAWRIGNGDFLQLANTSFPHISSQMGKKQKKTHNSTAVNCSEPGMSPLSDNLLYSVPPNHENQWIDIQRLSNTEDYVKTQIHGVNSPYKFPFRNSLIRYPDSFKTLTTCIFPHHGTLIQFVNQCQVHPLKKIVSDLRFKEKSILQ